MHTSTRKQFVITVGQNFNSPFLWKFQLNFHKVRPETPFLDFTLLSYIRPRTGLLTAQRAAKRSPILIKERKGHS